MVVDTGTVHVSGRFKSPSQLGKEPIAHGTCTSTIRTSTSTAVVASAAQCLQRLLALVAGVAVSCCWCGCLCLCCCGWSSMIPWSKSNLVLVPMRSLVLLRLLKALGDPRQHDGRRRVTRSSTSKTERWKQNESATSSTSSQEFSLLFVRSFDRSFVRPAGNLKPNRFAFCLQGSANRTFERSPFRWRFCCTFHSRSGMDGCG